MPIDRNYRVKVGAICPTNYDENVKYRPKIASFKRILKLSAKYEMIA